jgi:hypothetical protein
MIKITFCLVRRPDLSREEFLAYWYDKHRLLMLEVKDIIQCRRYIQTHSLAPEASEPARASRGAPPGFDGVAEAWYDSFDERAKRPPDPAAAAAAAEAGRRLVEDEKNFIDLSRSPIFWGEEKIVVPGDPAHFLG